MSDAELIGIISSIISIVDASLKIYEAVEDASSLPRCFRNVAARLPVVQDTLETARATLQEEEDKEDMEKLSRIKSRDALVKILESCYDKATMLNKTLQTIMPTQGTSKTRRYVKAIQMFPAADKIESLMNGILHDVHVLAANHSVKSATRTQVNDLIDMIRNTKVEKREYIYTDCRTTATSCNTGRESKFVHDGQGNRNMSLGTGIQFSGTSTTPSYSTLIRRPSTEFFETSMKRVAPKIEVDRLREESTLTKQTPLSRERSLRALDNPLGLSYDCEQRENLNPSPSPRVADSTSTKNSYEARSYFHITLRQDTCI